MFRAHMQTREPLQRKQALWLFWLAQAEVAEAWTALIGRRGAAETASQWARFRSLEMHATLRVNRSTTCKASSSGGGERGLLEGKNGDLDSGKLESSLLH